MSMFGKTQDIDLDKMVYVVSPGAVFNVNWETGNDKLAQKRKRGVKLQQDTMYASCARCWIPMYGKNSIKSHDTFCEYFGMSPICDECWDETSIEVRLVYYRALWCAWLLGAQSEKNQYEIDKLMDRWSDIESTVRDGG